jgi:glycerol uptake facilitator-like aquaporin
MRNILVEFFGTLGLVYFSNWANLLYELNYLSLAGYGLVYGLVLSILIYIGLDTSGAHFDPSVTVRDFFFCHF